MVGPNQRVVPYGKKWAVKAQGGSRPSATFDTKKEAMARARQIAKKYGSKVIAHRENGTTQKSSGVSKKKTTKRKTVKRKTSAVAKRKATKRKTTKRKASKRKATKRKTTTRRAVKRTKKKKSWWKIWR